MQADHPEIKSLAVEQSGIGKVVVAITARQPLARWTINAK